MYFYGQQDATLWWDLPYPEALGVQRKLANEVLTIENAKSDDYNMHKVKRICDAISDIDKKLSDKPRKHINTKGQKYE